MNLHIHRYAMDMSMSTSKAHAFLQCVRVVVNIDALSSFSSLLIANAIPFRECTTFFSFEIILASITLLFFVDIFAVYVVCDKCRFLRLRSSGKRCQYFDVSRCVCVRAFDTYSVLNLAETLFDFTHQKSDSRMSQSTITWTRIRVKFRSRNKHILSNLVWIVNSE